MEQYQMAKQMIDFNKTTFDSTFNAMVLLQDQAEKLVFDYLEKATWFPEEGKKPLTNGSALTKKHVKTSKTHMTRAIKKLPITLSVFPKRIQQPKLQKSNSRST